MKKMILSILILGLAFVFAQQRRVLDIENVFQKWSEEATTQEEKQYFDFKRIHSRWDARGLEQDEINKLYSTLIHQGEVRKAAKARLAAQLEKIKMESDYNNRMILEQTIRNSYFTILHNRLAPEEAELARQIWNREREEYAAALYWRRMRQIEQMLEPEHIQNQCKLQAQQDYEANKKSYTIALMEARYLLRLEQDTSRQMARCIYSLRMRSINQVVQANPEKFDRIKEELIAKAKREMETNYSLKPKILEEMAKERRELYEKSKTIFEYQLTMARSISSMRERTKFLVQAQDIYHLNLLTLSSREIEKRHLDWCQEISRIRPAVR